MEIELSYDLIYNELGNQSAGLWSVMNNSSPDTLHVHDDGLLLGEDVVVLQLVLEVHPHCSRGHFKVLIKTNSPPRSPVNDPESNNVLQFRLVECF